MTVEDNRGVTGVPNIFRDVFYPDAKHDITQADKNAWIERLESASSNKALGVLHSEDGSAACALGHLSDVIPDLVFIPTDLYNEIVKLNDVDNLTLPEIAVWVKENVEVVD